MKTLTIHLFEILACSGALLGLYILVIERRVSFRWCRRYLVASMALAALIPLVDIPVWSGGELWLDPLPALPAAAPATAAEAPSMRPEAVAAAIYALGAAIIAALLLLQLLRIGRLRRAARLDSTPRYTIVNTRRRISSFSFLRSIYVWEGLPAEELPAVVAHEASHIRHRHSIERLAMEALKAALWWNPFVWIASRRLTEVQEFEADSDVLRSGFDRTRYMSTIFRQLFGYSPEIANSLRDSLTKKRFEMMLTHTPGRHALLRLAATIPVVLGLACAFSFSTKAAQIRYTDRTAAIETTDLATAAALADGDRKPLVIVDGVERPSLDGLDPSQIQEISILKDASATTLYGDRARDGVIVVTLKPAPGTPADKSVDRPIDPDTPFLTASVMPRFQGGNLSDFRTWVQGRLRYPAEAMESKQQGRVVVQFIVERDGSVAHVETIACPSESLAAEAVRVVSASSGLWTPGSSKDEKVRIIYTLPVDFRISDGDENKAAADRIEVRGRVVDAGNTPLQGALVVSRGTTSGVVTDKEGAFSIRVAPTATLDVSLVGYETVGVRADTQELTVVLVKGGATTADEIVVVSYGQRKR